MTGAPEQAAAVLLELAAVRRPAPSARRPARPRRPGAPPRGHALRRRRRSAASRAGAAGGSPPRPAAPPGVSPRRRAVRPLWSAPRSARSRSSASAIERSCASRSSCSFCSALRRSGIGAGSCGGELARRARAVGDAAIGLGADPLLLEAHLLDLVAHPLFGRDRVVLRRAPGRPRRRAAAPRASTGCRRKAGAAASPGSAARDGRGRHLRRPRQSAAGLGQFALAARRGRPRAAARPSPLRASACRRRT